MFRWWGECRDERGQPWGRGAAMAAPSFCFLMRRKGRGGQERGGATRRGGAARERKIRVSLGCFGPV